MLSQWLCEHGNRRARACICRNRSFDIGVKKESMG